LIDKWLKAGVLDESGENKRLLRPETLLDAREIRVTPVTVRCTGIE